ncbi:phage portal protein, partial [Commensalibacter papalotli (ex Botero et al. 2024)]
WNYIEKETDWGRPKVVHYFETQRADEHRGGAGILTPIIQRLKMIIKYDQTEMDAAVLNAFLVSSLLIWGTLNISVYGQWHFSLIT